MTTSSSKSKLLSSIKETANYKRTENGAVALKSTLEPLLDAFGEMGALRMRDEGSIIRLFMDAYSVDPLLALKMLFYTRDIRGGLGERRTFKVIATHLAVHHTANMRVNLPLIPEFGRWDDLYCFVDTPLEHDAFQLIKKQFRADMAALQTAEPGHAPKISLLGKWLKSENASSRESKELGRLTRRYLELSSAAYRKSLTALRKAIKIVESDMSRNEWGNIDYEAVPSCAALRYRSAFYRHDANRYATYLDSVKKDTAKINAATLYPYDLVRKYIAAEHASRGWFSDDNSLNSSEIYDETVEAQWKALPDYLTGDDKFLVMADVSGSMYCDDYAPISTSVGLAIYFAEHSKGEFANNFITFTDVPELVTLDPKLSLCERASKVLETAGYDTNIEAAFELVLKSAVSHNLSQEDLPKAIVIISDMEFNQFGIGDNNLNFTSEMERRFAEAGYTMPTLVYWNVCARQDTFHAVADQNVRFISGLSASIFKGLCENMGYSATDLMLNTLNSERYSGVKLAEE